MASLDHYSISATFPPSSTGPLIVLLTLCASPLPLAHAPRATRVLPAASPAGGVPGRQRRAAAGSERPAVEENGARASEAKPPVARGTALCPPTGAAPTVTITTAAPLKTESYARATTARTSPSFTPLLPGLIAGGVGITLMPQRPWIPVVPLRERPNPTEPFFEDPESNVTGRAGSAAYLDCRIEMQQDLAVTWLHRKEDSIQLLTVGRHPYSGDSRFLLSHEDPNNWRLQILPVMKSDEGLYECQIATHPIKVRKVFFQVTAPELKILDEDLNELVERRYKAGSEVKLTCLATQLEEEDGLGGEEEVAAVGERQWVEGDFASTSPSLQGGVGSRVLWRHGDSTITRNTAGKTLRPISSQDGRTVSVVLTFHAIKPEDGGSYTCSLGVVSSAAVHIKILNGISDGESPSMNSALSPESIELCVFSRQLFTLLSFIISGILSQRIQSS